MNLFFALPKESGGHCIKEKGQVRAVCRGFRFLTLIYLTKQRKVERRNDAHHPSLRFARTIAGAAVGLA